MSYPADRAFVVQFSADADLGRDLAIGRAEHLESGTRCRFNSLAELVEFMKKVLAPATVTTMPERGDPKGGFRDEDM